MSITAVAIELLTFHMVDGRAVQVNPVQVTQLIHPPAGGNTQIVEAVKCVIRLTDGSFVSVAETCEAVEKAMEKAKP